MYLPKMCAAGALLILAFCGCESRYRYGSHLNAIEAHGARQVRTRSAMLYRGKGSLPPDSLFRAEVVELARRHAPILRLTSEQFPIAVTAVTDSLYIDSWRSEAGHRSAVVGVSESARPARDFVSLARSAVDSLRGVSVDSASAVRQIMFFCRGGAHGKSILDWYSIYRNLDREQKKVVYCHPYVDDGDGALVLQYWFFYLYNDWLNQHEGDWEHINVILPSDGSGEGWLPPEHVEYYFHKYVTTRPAMGERPVVFVGGSSDDLWSNWSGGDSHASYPEEGIVQRIHGMVNERVDGRHDVDATRPGGRLVLLPDVEQVDWGDSLQARTWSWLGIPALWGYPFLEAFWVHLPVLKRSSFVGGQAAPLGPAYHGAWNRRASEAKGVTTLNPEIAPGMSWRPQEVFVQFLPMVGGVNAGGYGLQLSWRNPWIKHIPIQIPLYFRLGTEGSFTRFEDERKWLIALRAGVGATAIGFSKLALRVGVEPRAISWRTYTFAGYREESVTAFAKNQINYVADGHVWRIRFGAFWNRLDGHAFVLGTETSDMSDLVQGAIEAIRSLFTSGAE